MNDKPIEQNSNQEDNNDSNSKEHDEILVPEELQSLLSDPQIPKEQKQNILSAFLSISVRGASSFRGPIPPPEILKGYNDVIKDGAERIVGMAEKQSNHRMQLEDHAIKEELKQSRNGQVFGFILGLIGLGLATALAMFGHETIAGIFGTTTIVGLVTVFVLGKRAQRADLSEKDE